MCLRRIRDAPVDPPERASHLDRVHEAILRPRFERTQEELRGTRRKVYAGPRSERGQWFLQLLAHQIGQRVGVVWAASGDHLPEDRTHGIYVRRRADVLGLRPLLWCGISG